MFQIRKRRPYQTILQDQIKEDHSYNLQRIEKRESPKTKEELGLADLITLSIIIRNEKE